MKVILAHTLKPPTENRINLKLSFALSEIKDLKIKVLGSQNFQLKDDYCLDGVDYESPFRHGSGTFSTFENQAILWKFVKDWRPNAIVCCSPDLLLITILARWRYGTKVIFDCQENFALNFRYQKHSGWWKSLLFSRLWSLFLVIIIKWIDRVWLAEDVYQTQLPVLSKKARVFENRLSPVFANEDLESAGRHFPTLTFTGVVSEESGVLEAARFLSQFKTQFQDWKTQIIGFCPNEELNHHLQKEYNKNGQLLKIDRWIPSSEILKAVENSDAVLMPYRESKANLGKVPTKYYEALYLGKPVLVQQGSDFAKLASQHGAGIEVNFAQPDKNDWNLILAQILEYKPATVHSKSYIFDAEGLRNDFLALVEPGSDF